MTARPRIEKLGRHHAVDGFESGQPELDRFLTRYALQAQQANASQTYVGLAGDDVIGFFTLVVGEVDHEAAAPRMTKGLSRHPVPVMILARLAVRRSWHGQGVGSGLLVDAMRRTHHAADIAGIRALIVHAKDEAAAAFYLRFGFAPSPTDERHLFVLIGDMRKSLAAKSAL